MYEYIPVTKPSLTTKSLFARRGNQTVNIRKVKGEIEVSLAVKDGYFPAFDIKLVNDRLRSRYGLTLAEYQNYSGMLTRIRDAFPEPSDGFGVWEERVRS